MGLLDGKRLLITGVITDASLAFHAAKIAQEQGAQVVLTGFGRMRLVERIAQRLPEEAPVVELDVSDQAQLDSLAERISPHLGDTPGLDGVLHSIGFAPASCLGEGAFLNAPWEDVATTIQVSAYSFKSLATAAAAADRVRARRSSAWTSTTGRRGPPTTGWASRSPRWSPSPATSPATSGPKGIRVNLCAAGPVRTMAAKSIPGLRRVRGRLGRPGAAGLGRRTTRCRWRRRSARCCRTGCPSPPDRWCGRTVGSMPSAFDALLVLSFGGPEGPRRGAAVPGERHARAGGAPGAAGRRRGALPALRRGQPAQRPQPRADRGHRGRASICRCTSATATGTRWSRTPSREMARDGVRRALVFATSAYGGYSACRQYHEDIARARKAVGEGAPELVQAAALLRPPAFVVANADAVRAAFAEVGAAARLVFTAHSVPAAADASAGPPAEGGHRYSRQVAEAARLVAADGGRRLTTTWCGSRGPGRRRCRGWSPDILDHLDALARRGHVGGGRRAGRVRVRPRRGGVGPRHRGAASGPPRWASGSPAPPRPAPTRGSRTWSSS